MRGPGHTRAWGSEQLGGIGLVLPEPRGVRPAARSAGRRCGPRPPTASRRRLVGKIRTAPVSASATPRNDAAGAWKGCRWRREAGVTTGSTSPRGAHHWSRPAGCPRAVGGARSSARTAPPHEAGPRDPAARRAGPRRRLEGHRSLEGPGENHPRGPPAQRDTAGGRPGTHDDPGRAPGRRFPGRARGRPGSPARASRCPWSRRVVPLRGNLVVAHHQREGGWVPRCRTQPDRPPAGVSSDPTLGGPQHRGGISRDRRDNAGIPERRDQCTQRSADRRETASVLASP